MKSSFLFFPYLINKVPLSTNWLYPPTMMSMTMSPLSSMTMSPTLVNDHALSPRLWQCPQPSSMVMSPTLVNDNVPNSCQWPCPQPSSMTLSPTLPSLINGNFPNFVINNVQTLINVIDNVPTLVNVFDNVPALFNAHVSTLINADIPTLIKADTPTFKTKMSSLQLKLLFN